VTGNPEIISDRDTTVSQSVALFVEVEPNGFADRWTGKDLNRDKLG